MRSMARHEEDSPGTVDSPVTQASPDTPALPGTPASQVLAEFRALRRSLDTVPLGDPSSAGQLRRGLRGHEFPFVERDSHRVGLSTALPMEIAPDVGIGIAATGTMTAAAVDG